MLRPGDLIGVPAGIPDPVAHVALFRWLLVALAGACGALVARGRTRLAAAAALAFGTAAIGFWILTLGRPYGVFVDPARTVQAANRAVAVESGRAGEGFLVGEPVAAGWVVSPAAASWLPLFVFPLAALMLGALAAPGDRWIAAVL